MKKIGHRLLLIGIALPVVMATSIASNISSTQSGVTATALTPSPIAEKPVLGVSFVRRKNGCKVRSIYEGGPAYKAGMRVGDYLQKVNDTPVDKCDPEEIALLISRSNPVTLEFRNAQQQIKTVTLTKVPRSALGDTLQMRPDDYLDELTVGRPVPDFTALPPRGKQVKLSEFRGKPILVVFWATWNKASVDELKALQAIERTYRASGLQIIGVNLDTDKGLMDKFLADCGIAWPQHFDGLGFRGGVVLEWGVPQLPVTVLIDRAGNLVNKNLKGPTRDAELSKVTAP